MLQVKKSRFCGISAIFCQCCFIIEGFTFQGGLSGGVGVGVQLGALFISGGSVRASVLMGCTVNKKKHGMVAPHPPTMENPITFSSLIIFGISETRAVSFDAVMCIFRGSSIEAYSVSVSLLFSLTSFLLEIYFQ